MNQLPNRLPCPQIPHLSQPDDSPSRPQALVLFSHISMARDPADLTLPLSVVHTLAYLRTTCPILLDTILATSARFFRPHLAGSLGEHALIAVNRATIDGACYLELVQALCILVYWKRPTDKSAWIKLGLALRIAYQLRMHEMPQCGSHESEGKRRLALVSVGLQAEKLKHER
jgi:hypothetical protein